MLLAALGIVLLSAAATAVLAVNEIGKVVEALGQNRAVKLAPRVLAPAARGEPQTLLLVGDDRRPPPRRNPGGFVLPHSNEMLLVRIDPSKPTIAMLSIPRELQVTIRPPGARPVVNRINAAYTIGGIQLMTETIKQVLGVAVNHVFVVTFPRFKRAITGFSLGWRIRTTRQRCPRRSTNRTLSMVTGSSLSSRPSFTAWGELGLTALISSSGTLAWAFGSSAVHQACNSGVTGRPPVRGHFATSRPTA